MKKMSSQTELKLPEVEKTEGEFVIENPSSLLQASGGTNLSALETLKRFEKAIGSGTFSHAGSTVVHANGTLVIASGESYTLPTGGVITVDNGHVTLTYHGDEPKRAESELKKD